LRILRGMLRRRGRKLMLRFGRFGGADPIPERDEGHWRVFQGVDWSWVPMEGFCRCLIKNGMMELRKWTVKQIS
jgi:hypothetical protein